MAAEARAESPAPAAPPPPVPEKRAAPADVGREEEERPGPKRRRAFVATLDGVPCAAAAEEDGQRDGLSFSFQHSRGGFVPLETTPKFGSFNPPAAAEQQETPDLNPAPPAGQDSPAVEEEDDAASPRAVADHQDGNSESVAAEVDQGEPERQDESESADVHHP